MPLNVYYLDDERDLLEMFVDLFSGPDTIIQTFSTSKDLLEAVAKELPDVVFLDYRMPGKTGDQVALLLPETLPKALITGDLTVTSKAQFMVCFEKPYRAEEIENFLAGLRAAAS